jgi:hypothetical protein
MLIHCFFVPAALGARMHRVLKRGLAHAFHLAHRKIAPALVAVPTRAVAIRVCVAVGLGFAGGAGSVVDGAGAQAPPLGKAGPSESNGFPDIPISFEPDWPAAPVDPLLSLDPGGGQNLPDDPMPPAPVVEPPGILLVALGLLAGAALRARPRLAASIQAIGEPCARASTIRQDAKGGGAMRARAG